MYTWCASLALLLTERELIDQQKPSRFCNFASFGEAFRLIKDLEEISVTQRPQEMPLHFYSAPLLFPERDVSSCWKLALYVRLMRERVRETHVRRMWRQDLSWAKQKTEAWPFAACISDHQCICTKRSCVHICFWSDSQTSTVELLTGIKLWVFFLCHLRRNPAPYWSCLFQMR